MNKLFYLFVFGYSVGVSWGQSVKTPRTLPQGGQTQVLSVDPNDGLHPSMISVVQPSPEAAALGKYGEVPVSLYTGIPSIQVPLYTVAQGSLNLAVALSYHAGGVKIDEISSSVGLNWSLNAGGVITRTIHGNPDDQSGGYQTADVQNKLSRYRNGQMGTTERKEFEHDVADGIYDTEPDEYFYNFLGTSGRMVYDASGNPLLLNHTMLKIRFDTNIDAGSDGFVITDEAGTEYQFTEKETVKPTTYCMGKTPTYTATSGWWLTKIKPLIGKPIDLSYQTLSNVTYSQGINQQRTFIRQNSPLFECQERNSQCISVFRGTMKQIQTITFDKGRIDFTYEARVDMNGPAQRLKQLSVHNLTELLIKQYEFDYEYGGITRFALKQIRETTDPALDVPTHNFEYPHFQDLPPRNSPAQDHWGYYNGNSTGQLIPAIDLPGNPTGYIWANREPDAQRTTYGLLTRINYPTGGHTEFVYESHDYGYLFSNEAPQSVNLAGGVRIRQIISRDGTNLQSDQVKTYEYRMNANPTRSSGCLVQQFVYQFDFLTENLRNTGPGENASAYSCSFIEASSSSQAYLGATQGGHIGYEEVTVYHHQDKQKGGKTWHKFSSFRDSPDTYLQGNWFSLPFPPPTSKDDYRGRELRTIDYKFEQGSFSKVLEKEYQYSFQEPAQVNGIKMRFALRSYAKPRSEVASNEYGYSRVWAKLDKEIETLTENSGTITKESNYIYSPTHLQLVEKRTTSSAGNTLISRYKYPLDYTLGNFLFPSSEVVALQNLQSKNVVSALVEQTQLVIKPGSSTEQVLGSVYQSYKYDQVGLRDAIYKLDINAPLTNWQPFSVDAAGHSQKDAHYQETIKFDEYDQYGNILQQHEINNMVTSYGWGYGSSLPIVEAKNSSYADLLQKTPGGFASLSTDAAIQTTVLNLQQSSPQSLVKGYTHIPLRGLSSSIEVNGLTTYFEFDNLNRLVRIKNNNHDIVKEYAYAYRGVGTSGGTGDGGNQPPSLSGSIPDQIATLNQAFTYTLPGSLFADPEGQTLTYTLNGLPAGLSFASGVISGTPTAFGYSLVTLTATDPGGLSSSVSFFLTVSSCFAADPYIVTGSFSPPTPVSISAYNHIETDGVQSVLVNSSASLTLKAGQSVRLKPGFVIKPGAAFRAYTGPCN